MKRGIMKRAILVLIFFITISGCRIRERRIENPNFDFSSMDRFWEIVSILEGDQEPTTEQWDSLFETPGYAVLTKSEFKKEFFIRNFRLTFMPSNAEELEEELRNGRNRFVKHYVRLKNMKEEIKRQQKWLQTTELMKEALNCAQEYLPEKMIKDYPLPPVSFLIFDMDARGYSPIVVDIIFSIDNGEFLPYLLGHESHHFYRNKILVINPDIINTTNECVIWVLNQIQAEGIADQIDKRIIFFNGGPFEQSQWSRRYKSYLEESPEIIKGIDKLLRKMADSTSNYQKIGCQLYELVPMSGHPTGYYMTNAIIDELGRETLIKEVGNPFAFFRLYNQVAKMKGSNKPSFSEKSMRLINKLEKKYVKNRKK